MTWGKLNVKTASPKDKLELGFFSSPAISIRHSTTVHCMFIVYSMLYTCNVNSSDLNFVFVSHHCMQHNYILHVLDASLTVQTISGREWPSLVSICHGFWDWVGTAPCLSIPFRLVCAYVKLIRRNNLFFRNQIFLPMFFKMILRWNPSGN